MKEKKSIKENKTNLKTKDSKTSQHFQEEVSNFESFSYAILIFISFLIPLFYLPFSGLDLWASKVALIFGGSLICLILFLIFSLKKNKLPYRKSFVIVAAWFLPLVYFISSLFSTNPGKSLTGRFFEPGTCGFIVLMVVLLSLTAVLFKNKKRIFSFLFITIFSGFLLLLIELAVLFLGLNIFAFAGLDSHKQALIGGWNNFALFASFLAIISVLMFENIKSGWFLKVILYCSIIFSVFFLIIIDFLLAWLMLSIFSFALLVYFLFKYRIGWGENAFLKTEGKSFKTHGRYFFVFPLIILSISIGVILSGDFVNKSFSNFVQISSMEARPSWSTTLLITKNVYEDDGFLGTGPNTFENQWSKFKPQEINDSLFWNKDFSTGVGFIPTEITTTGVLGMLFWILFFVVFIGSGVINLLFKKASDEFSYFLSLTTFLGAVYFLGASLFYNTNSVLITLAFIFAGGYIASASLLKGSRDKKIFHFSECPRFGFIAVFIMSLLLIVSFVWLYFGVEKYFANNYYNHASELYQKGELKNSKDYLSTAVSLDDMDVYRRLQTQIMLDEINSLLKGKEKLKQEDQEKFRNILASAINSSRRAVKMDNDDYKNYMRLGDVYASVVPLGVEGSYKKALENYKKSAELNSSNPEIYLKMGRLEISKKNFKEAQKYLVKTLEKKSDYTQAVYLLSQTYVAEGEINSAIASTKSAINMDPQNPALFFQLGLLEYKKENYKKSSNALEKAIKYAKNYANARYYLGLAYNKQGKNKKAIRQFESLEKANPENEELKVILENLKAGREPFVNISEQKPEKKKELPM